MSTLAEKLASVRQRIAKSCERCGRSPAEVKLVAVTKETTVDVMREAILLGVAAVGENRMQDALAKYDLMSETAEWHLIGHLQTNKAKDAVAHFALIHSVDSLRLAEAIEKEAARHEKTQDILVQVNTSGEPSKYGIRPDEAAGLVEAIARLPHLKARGLMTMAPLVGDPEQARPVFRKLRELRDTLPGMRELSMGMSNDFEIAIEEGATIVRVGSAIFKS